MSDREATIVAVPHHQPRHAVQGPHSSKRITQDQKICMSTQIVDMLRDEGGEPRREEASDGVPTARLLVHAEVVKVGTTGGVHQGGCAF